MRALLIAVLLGALVGLSGSARAAVVVHTPLEDLAQEAVLIVRGVVKGHRATMAPGRGVIWTRHRLRIEKTLSGEARRTLTVRVRGGRMRRTVAEAPGTPELRDGDRVVLFLWEDADGEFRVLGMAQGAFRVTRDEATGAQVCRNSLAGLTIVDRAGAAIRAQPTRLSLLQLEKRVAAALERKAAREDEKRKARERVLRERAQRAARRTERTRGKPGSPPE